MRAEIGMRSFLRFAISASISFFVLLILVGVLTGMGQGVTMIIDLFYHWPNMLFTILLVNFLALILSHFPYYFEIGIKDQNHDLKWKRSYDVSVFSIVYHARSELSKFKESILITVMRRHIGIITYAIWFYILLSIQNRVSELDVSSGFFAKDIDIWPQFIVWNLVFLILHIALQTHYTEIKKQIKKADTADKKVEVEKVVRNYLNGFNILFFINIIFTSLFIYSVFKDQWSGFNLRLALILTGLNALLYLVFRIFRSWFVYFSYDQSRTLGEDEYFARDLSPGFKVPSILPFRLLASTPNYLASMSLFGILVIIPTFVLGLFTIDQVKIINPVPLFIVVIIFYYSALVIILKHYIYYKSKLANNEGNKKLNEIMSRLLMILPIAFIVGTFLMSGVENDLHTIPLVEEKSFPIVEPDSFARSFDTIPDQFYVVGSYGGGIKANIWNLFLLNRIKDQKPSFLNNTLCMSGVSGGAIGLANFTSILHNHDSLDYDKIDGFVDQIASANMLSNDLFGWMVKDYLREIIPSSLYKFKGKDRSWVSMKIYSKLTGDNGKALNKSMRDYWAETYKKLGYYPAIIFNTTPTSNNYGVASSVKVKNFPIAIDILDHSYLDSISKSISFYGAASTANRFPFFSPAARIPMKGHFIDGGAFENSGLLNTIHFAEELFYINELDIKELIAINVVNDKSIYILEKFEPYRSFFEVRKELPEGEMLAMVKGAIALERMPNFIREEIAGSGVELISLHMPYYLTVEDVKSTFKIDEFSIEQAEAVKLILEENNWMVMEALRNHEGYDEIKWGIVEPPLGRLMSKPAIEYQRAMILYHEELNEYIQSL